MCESGCDTHAQGDDRMPIHNLICYYFRFTGGCSALGTTGKETVLRKRTCFHLGS